MNELSKALALLVVTAASLGCQTARHGQAQKGAAVGGLTGAAIGAIAAPKGKKGPGAAIGAGLGALTGAVVGNTADQRQEKVEEATIDVAEVVSLSQAGVADNLIISQIYAQGVVARPTSDEIIFLQQHGISEPVIQALQEVPTVAHEVTNVVVLGRAPAPSMIARPRRRPVRRFW